VARHFSGPAFQGNISTQLSFIPPDFRWFTTVFPAGIIAEIPFVKHMKAMKKTMLMTAAIFAIGGAGLFAQIPDNKKNDPAKAPADTVYRNVPSELNQKGTVETDNPTTPPRKNDEMMDKQKDGEKRDTSMKSRSKTKPK